MLRIREKDAIRRKRRIDSILRALPSATSLKLLGDPGTLPLIHLFGASQQFILGFYENSILHSAFAAEYGILLRLNDKLDRYQKSAIADGGGLSFSAAIKRSTGELIDGKLAERLRLLNNLRNMGAHPSNWVTLIKQLDQNLFLNQEAMRKWISEATNEDAAEIICKLKDLLEPAQTEQALDRLVTFKEKQFGKMPDLEWAAHQSTLKLQTNMVKDYSKKMIKEMLLGKKIVEMINNPRDIIGYIQKKYRYPEEIALSGAMIAYDTLKKLKFLNL